MGTRIYGFSNMFKVATGDEPVSVLHGVISAKTKLNARRGSFEVPYDGPVYVVDAITNNPGAAGGVITTTDGKLLGVIGKELRNAESNTWINYAIPITELKDVIKEIITGKYIEREKKPDEDENPNRYRPLDFGIVLIPDILYRTPAYVETVVKGSAAEKLGLKPDDLILFVNDNLIQSSKVLQKELGVLEAGDTLTAHRPPKEQTHLRRNPGAGQREEITPEPKNQIRNPNLEIRNKFQIQNPHDQNVRDLANWFLPRSGYIHTAQGRAAHPGLCEIPTIFYAEGVIQNFV